MGSGDESSREVGGGSPRADPESWGAEVSKNLVNKRVLRLTWIGDKQQPSPIDSFFRVQYITPISGGAYSFTCGKGKAEIMDVEIARAWLVILTAQIDQMCWKITMERPLP